MGMFDYLQIDNKWLPEDAKRPYQEQEFQTKDFDCLLQIYNITESGAILKSIIAPEGEYFIAVPFNGEVNFYDFYERADGTTYLRDFIAYVHNDFVVDVTEISGSSNRVSAGKKLKEDDDE